MGAVKTRRRRPRARFDVKRIVADMTLRGWNNQDLARAARVSDMTITRFLSGDTQTAKTNIAIARALGFGAKRYFIDVVDAERVSDGSAQRASAAR
jgi:transcriptional regulator with XRE-family HTH domain